MLHSTFRTLSDMPLPLTSDTEDGVPESTGALSMTGLQLPGPFCVKQQPPNPQTPRCTAFLQHHLSVKAESVTSYNTHSVVCCWRTGKRPEFHQQPPPMLYLDFSALLRDGMVRIRRDQHVSSARRPSLDQAVPSFLIEFQQKETILRHRVMVTSTLLRLTLMLWYTDSDK